MNNLFLFLGHPSEHGDFNPQIHLERKKSEDEAGEQGPSCRETKQPYCFTQYILPSPSQA